MEADNEQQLQQEHVGGAETAPIPDDGRSRRDPGGPKGAMVAWLAILGVVGFILLAPLAVTLVPEWFEPPAEESVVIAHTPPGGLMRLTSEYAIGATSLLGGESDAAGELPEKLMEQVDAFSAASRSDELRAAIVASALLGNDAGIERLDALDAQDEQAEKPVVLSPELIEAKAIARRVMTKGSSTLDEEQRATIVQTEGWFGELLLIADQPEDNAEREALYQGAVGIVALLVAVFVGVLVAGFIGLGLFVTAIVLLVNDKIRPRYAPPAPGGSVFVETFALFLVFVFLLFFGAGIVREASGLNLDAYMRWLIFPVLFWPLIRGVDWSSWKHAMGWHTGRGVFREIGAGVLGYFAGLPIFAVGVGLTLALMVIIELLIQSFGGESGAPMSHPIIDQVGSGGVLGIVMLYLLAAVWAPLFEESFFRGALYHHVRGRLGAVASALVVAFIFAAIHPQGIAAIPALMSLAVVFALIREWRGSMIGPMVAHSMHNATLVTVMLLALG